MELVHFVEIAGFGVQFRIWDMVVVVVVKVFLLELVYFEVSIG
jgi:hypothetical protein